MDDSTVVVSPGRGWLNAMRGEEQQQQYSAPETSQVPPEETRPYLSLPWDYWEDFSRTAPIEPKSPSDPSRQSRSACRSHSGRSKLPN